MKTGFASPERSNESKIIKQHEALGSYNFINEVFEALPYIALIINTNRQVVFANTVLLDTFGISSITDILGQRPGELIRCIHHDTTEYGCGTSESCRYCGAINAILKSWETNTKVSEESRITSTINGAEVHFDLLVTSSPFTIEDEKYAIVSINDISDKKRKEALEQVFFHDIINTAGGLKGLVDVLQNTGSSGKVQNMLPALSEVTTVLLESIQAQRDIVLAETGDLIINKTRSNSLEIINSALSQLQYHSVSRDKEIYIMPESERVIFSTDTHILNRVLVNLLKNALEASGKMDRIYAGCRLEGDTVVFTVSNPAYMPPEVQSQLFQRSFSTKGNNRGTGTYSIKLFVEKCLKGSVSFTSSVTDGTEFTVALPRE